MLHGDRKRPVPYRLQPYTDFAKLNANYTPLRSPGSQGTLRMGKNSPQIIQATKVAVLRATETTEGAL